MPHTDHHAFKTIPVAIFRELMFHSSARRSIRSSYTLRRCMKSKAHLVYIVISVEYCYTCRTGVRSKFALDDIGRYTDVDAMSNTSSIRSSQTCLALPARTPRLRRLLLLSRISRFWWLKGTHIACVPRIAEESRTCRQPEDFPYRKPSTEDQQHPLSRVEAWMPSPRCLHGQP